MEDKKFSSLCKRICTGLFFLVIILLSGCLLKKEPIPEYFPKSPVKLDKKHESGETGKSEALAETIAEIKTTIQEDITPLPNTIMQKQEKDRLQKEHLTKNINKEVEK